MGLSYLKYKGRLDLTLDIQKEILGDYKNSDYEEDDKLEVSIHRVIDNFVSFISINDLQEYLNFFSNDDIRTIDKGMLPEITEEDKNKYDRCLLYCLIEQDLYNSNIEEKIKKEVLK